MAGRLGKLLPDDAPQYAMWTLCTLVLQARAALLGEGGGGEGHLNLWGG